MGGARASVQNYITVMMRMMVKNPSGSGSSGGRREGGEKQREAIKAVGSVRGNSDRNASWRVC